MHILHKRALRSIKTIEVRRQVNILQNNDQEITMAEVNTGAGTMRRTVRAVAKYFYALLGSAYLFTIGWIVSGRARGLVSTIAQHFGFPSSIYHLPSVETADIFTSACQVQLVELAALNGNIKLEELSTIAAIVSQNQPKAIFEIGTFDGRTTLNMALNSPSETRIFTLDLPRAQIDTTKLHITTGDRVFVDKPQSGARFANTGMENRIAQLHGDSADFDFSPYFGKIDLVFVDGSHAYEYVYNDTKVALQLLRNGHGVILWHDYTAWVGVTKALNELQRQNPQLREMKHITGTTLVYLKR